MGFFHQKHPAMRRLGVDLWNIQLIQATCNNAGSKVHIENYFSGSFCVNVGVCQGSVLSLLLFIMVLAPLSQEFSTGCPWELLYGDDWWRTSLWLTSWKVNLKNKGLRVNMKKIKDIFSGQNMSMLLDSVCGLVVFADLVCLGFNWVVFCSGYEHWVYKKCTSIQGRLVENASFRCVRCCSLARPIDACPCNWGTIITSFILLLRWHLIQLVVLPMVQLPELGLPGEDSESYCHFWPIDILHTTT